MTQQKRVTIIPDVLQNGQDELRYELVGHSETAPR